MHLKENKSFMKSFEYILLLSVLKYSSHCDFIIKIKFNTERGALSPALANLKQTEKPTLTYSHIATPIPSHIPLISQIDDYKNCSKQYQLRLIGSLEGWKLGSWPIL